MKAFGSIILILAYVALMVRPSVPLLEYAVNQDYIAAELCENKARPEMNCGGSCYLMKQLKKAAQESSKDKENNTEPIVVPVHLAGEVGHVPAIPQLSQSIWDNHACPDNFHPRVLVPPPRG